MLFPLHWSSVPPLLKDWQDAVLTRMNYYDRETKGARMRGLPLMVATTAGNPPTGYGPGSQHIFPLQELLRPLHATAGRCGWEWSNPFVFWSAVGTPEDTRAAEGQRYADRPTAFFGETAARSGD